MKKVLKPGTNQLCSINRMRYNDFRLIFIGSAAKLVLPDKGLNCPEDCLKLFIPRWGPGVGDGFALVKDGRGDRDLMAAFFEYAQDITVRKFRAGPVCG